jgi:glycerophosphoryl diester phosphodiesterase
MALIKKYKAAGRCVVGSKYDAVSRQMRKKYPETARFTSSRDIVLNYLAFKGGQKLPGDANAVASMPLERCGLHFDEAGFIDYLHGRGIKVFYWTINSSETAKILFSRSADGVITDDPGLFQNIR